MVTGIKTRTFEQSQILVKWLRHEIRMGAISVIFFDPLYRGPLGRA